MTIGSDHCRELAERIENIFAAGFQADAATVHFINSTFDYPDHRKLRRILNDADSCDRDGLIDLIISPDSTVCREMEAFLERAVFDETDIQSVLSLLPEETPASLRADGLTAAVVFSVPFSCRRRFLDQLNLTRKIDPDIRTALETSLPEQADRLATLAKIRHSRLVLTETRKTFLLRFVHMAGRVEKGQWFFYLDFILDLSGRQKTDNDLFSVFGAEKQNCLKQLENNRRLTEQLVANNMETLLLQGRRIGLSGDVSKLLQTIKTIDDICLLVWGRTPKADAPGFQDPGAVSILFEKEFPR